MKKLAALLAAGAMIFALTACGGTTAPQEKSGAAQPESKASQGENASGGADESERPYYVRDPETVKGKLTCYTTMEETQQAVVRELWQKYYPNCELEFQADSVGTLATRIRADEQSDADIMLGGLFAADGDAYHDILQPYTAACDKEQLYHDPAGYCTYYDVQVMCLIVNTALESQLGVEINGYNDLLNEKLRGKIILADPSASSSGWRQLQTMLAVMGDTFNDDKAWAYIEKLMPLSFSSTSSKDIYNLVINGEYVAGLSYESTVAALIKDGAADVKCVYMSEGNTAMAGGVGIIKNAPNLTAAQAMADLISSAEFQDARAAVSAGRGSNGNCDMSITGLPGTDTLKMVDLDYDYLATHKTEIIDKWNDKWANLH